MKKSFFLCLSAAIIMSLFSGCAVVEVHNPPPVCPDREYNQSWFRQVYYDLGDSNADIRKLKAKNRQLESVILEMKLQLEQLQKQQKSQ